MLTSVKRLKEVYYREGLRQQANQQVMSLSSCGALYAIVGMLVVGKGRI